MSSKNETSKTGDVKVPFTFASSNLNTNLNATSNVSNTTTTKSKNSVTSVFTFSSLTPSNTSTEEKSLRKTKSFSPIRRDFSTLRTTSTPSPSSPKTENLNAATKSNFTQGFTSNENTSAPSKPLSRQNSKAYTTDTKVNGLRPLNQVPSPQKNANEESLLCIKNVKLFHFEKDVQRGKTSQGKWKPHGTKGTVSVLRRQNGTKTSFRILMYQESTQTTTGIQNVKKVLCNAALAAGK